MIHSLQLRHGQAPEAALAAWFLPGDSADRWLDQLSIGGLASMDTRLFLVPHSLGDRSCAGVLVVPARVDSNSWPQGAQACRLIAGRIFVPMDGILHPPVTDSEVRTLCPLPVYFFHPVFGLSGFDEDSTLRIKDLIRAPENREDHWNSARAGAAALPGLLGVVLREPPSIEDIFGDAPDEIGSEPPEGLPPAPGEPQEGSITKTGRNLRKNLLKQVSDTLRKMPHTGARRTWINGMEDWVNRKLNHVNEELQQLRNKEINRLLHLLDTDPESGLRHAIPMNSFAPRGKAPPGGRLGSHSLNFDPRQLGGGPADYWNVPGNAAETLRRRYREMADREMQLGRHRRAAYIYAELLGDLPSAANALRQGRLFREAALLYEEHLKNPLEAAKCLADGGLLAEAIERYEKLGRWLEVADLQQRSGNPAAAENAIRRLVEERLAQGDVLGAAKLVDERLQAPDEALEMLFNTWPDSPQAASCVAAAFQILARLGRHQVALERVAQFSREVIPDALVPRLIAMLGGATRDYPHEPVRHRAANLSQTLIARQLKSKDLSLDETGRLLEHLVRLAPGDRLLSRDANRYLANRRSLDLRSRPVLPPPVPGNKPVLHRRFELPRQIQWLQLRREWHWFYALGVTAKRLTLLRGVWEGEYQSLSWECPEEALNQGFVFEPTIEQGRVVVLARPGGPSFAQKRFPAADRYFDISCLAGSPSWLPAQGFPCAIGEDSVWSMHVANGRAILSCFDKVQGKLQRTIDCTEDLIKDAERGKDTRLSLTVMGNRVAVALGNRLVLTRVDGKLTRVELPGQVIGLFATIPNTRQGVAVMLHGGAVMYWIGAESCTELDRDIQSPIGTFVPGGPLVLISGLQAVLLEADSRGVKSVTRMTLTGQRPVAVSATSNPGEFAVMGEHGEMTVYRMPRQN